MLLGLSWAFWLFWYLDNISDFFPGFLSLLGTSISCKLLGLCISLLAA
jgi:hypothetical protein